MSISARSLLQRVSNRRVRADVFDLMQKKKQQEQDRSNAMKAITQEQEDYSTINEIAIECGLRVRQQVTANGEEVYQILEQTSPQQWHIFQTFGSKRQAINYVLDYKIRKDEQLDRRAEESDYRTERERQ